MAAQGAPGTAQAPAEDRVDTVAPEAGECSKVVVARVGLEDRRVALGVPAEAPSRERGALEGWVVIPGEAAARAETPNTVQGARVDPQRTEGPATSTGAMAVPEASAKSAEAEAWVGTGSVPAMGAMADPEVTATERVTTGGLGARAGPPSAMATAGREVAGATARNTSWSQARAEMVARGGLGQAAEMAAEEVAEAMAGKGRSALGAKEAGAAKEAMLAMAERAARAAEGVLVATPSSIGVVAVETGARGATAWPPETEEPEVTVGMAGSS